jgi:hypothetical protein
VRPPNVLVAHFRDEGATCQIYRFTIKKAYLAPESVVFWPVPRTSMADDACYIDKEKGQKMDSWTRSTSQTVNKRLRTE